MLQSNTVQNLQLFLNRHLEWCCSHGVKPFKHVAWCSTSHDCAQAFASDERHLFRTAHLNNTIVHTVAQCVARRDYCFEHHKPTVDVVQHFQLFVSNVKGGEVPGLAESDVGPNAF